MFRYHLVHCLAVVLSIVCVALPAGAGAEEPPLTRVRVAELARTAPASRVAAAEVGVASAAVRAGGTLSLENPVISGMGGLRLNPDGTRPLAAVASISWPVDLGGRGARVEAARAEQRAAMAASDQAGRELLLAALLQHALVLRDERQLALAAERLALARRVVAAAKRQHEAGDVPLAEVALATVQEGREAGAEIAARGALDADRVTLLALLGLPIGPQPPAVTGTLVPAGEPPSLAVMLRDLGGQPGIRAAATALDAAVARSAREQASRWPTISVLAQYERDDDANIGMLGLAVPLPVLNANRQAVATSAAEVGAARARVTASRTSADGRIRELHARYLATKATLDALTPSAAAAIQALSIATRGYELGEPLSAVLLVRREVAEAQAALLEAEHAHANAKIELLVAAGKVPQ